MTRLPGPADVGPATRDFAAQDAARARDAGISLIARINRWTITAAVALSGVISYVAEQSFHGHTRSGSVSVSQSTQAPSSAPAASGGGALQPAAQPPTSAPSAAQSSAPAPVVSGGS